MILILCKQSALSLVWMVHPAQSEQQSVDHFLEPVEVEDTDDEIEGEHGEVHQGCPGRVLVQSGGHQVARVRHVGAGQDSEHSERDYHC